MMIFWWFMMMYHDVPIFLIEFFHSELLVFQRALHFLIVPELVCGNICRTPVLCLKWKWTMKCADYESIHFSRMVKWDTHGLSLGLPHHMSHIRVYEVPRWSNRSITCGSGLIFYRPTLQDFQHSNVWHFTTYKIYWFGNYKYHSFRLTWGWGWVNKWEHRSI